MSGQVHAFACNRRHPQLGDAVLCTRQRFHAGDHRSDHADTLREWSDPPAQPAAAPIVDMSDGTDLPDDWTAGTLETVRDPLWVAVLLVLVCVLIAAPAVIVILYGQAF